MWGGHGQANAGRENRFACVLRLSWSISTFAMLTLLRKLPVFDRNGMTLNVTISSGTFVCVPPGRRLTQAGGSQEEPLHRKTGDRRYRCTEVPKRILGGRAGGGGTHVLKAEVISPHSLLGGAYRQSPSSFGFAVYMYSIRQGHTQGDGLCVDFAVQVGTTVHCRLVILR